MLQIPQLQGIRLDDAQYYEALVAIQDAVNNISRKTGIDSSPANQNSAPGQGPNNFPPPGDPATISVAQSNGLFFVTLGASPTASAGIIYGVDVSMAPNFQPIQSFVLGSSQYATLLLGNVTAYFRAW